MRTTDAQKEASRINGRKSRGPAEAGRRVSRRNALKHGLTATVVLPDDAAEEVERRDEVLQQEMRPSGMLSAILVHRLAFLSVRLELCERHDAAGRAARVRHAEARFEDDRLTAIEEAFDHLADAPATYLRRLRQTPEGLDRLIQTWHDLLAALEAPEANGWNFVHVRIVANLLGSRPNDFPVPRPAALAEAVFGNFHHLRPADGDGLDNAGRREWARRELARGIASEVAELEARREAFDDEALELDRAEACERALFDPSPEAERYRKYEAATERGIYRTLQEFRCVEAEAAATVSDDEVYEAPGSFFQGAPEEALEEEPGAAAACAADPPPAPAPPPEAEPAPDAPARPVAAVPNGSDRPTGGSVAFRFDPPGVRVASSPPAPRPAAAGTRGG
jgi:hypothetical protein